MELTSNDKKVVDLLSKLKHSNGSYPSDILAARRETYLKQVTNIGLGIGVGAGIKNATKGGNSTGAVATVSSKILETVLIAAIAIESGTAAYLYRGKIADLVKSYRHSSNVQEVTPVTNNSASDNSGLVESTNTPIPTSTDIPTVMVVPSITINNNNSQNNNTSTSQDVNSTPSPDGNNGNHYGQTPKPAQTKNNNGGGNGNGGGGNGGGNGNGNGNGNGGGNGKNNKP